MSDVAVRVENVFKKFSLGEKHDSLRDLIPALTKRTAKRLVSGALAPKEFWALNDVSFDIKRGETVGIVGHNGAGKSTILKHLSGVLQPTTGKVNINGRLAALIEVGAGFHQDLTGRENIFLNGTILGMSRAQIRSRFDEIVDFSGLERFLDTPVKRYSSGMYARLGFSVAAHLEPDILVIDEVLSVGDAIFQAKGLAKMRSIAQSGATVIFVSHNLKSVADLCDRSLLMEKGRLLHDGPTSDVLVRYMETLRESRPLSGSGAVRVGTVSFNSGAGKRADFEPGESANFVFDITASETMTGINCVVVVRDEHFYDAFITSTAHLGIPPINLKAGETTTIEVNLDLHLAPGKYFVAIEVEQIETGYLLDNADFAATFIIVSDMRGGGCAQLYPRATLR